MNIIVFIFFFKQKTAYEMRISDWSSDVCSSDLRCKLPGEGVVNAILYEDPIGTHARLARIPKLGSNGSGNSRVQVRVVEHDERRVAAKFARQAFHGFSTICHQALANRCGTGERQFAHYRLFSKFGSTRPG